MFSKIEENIVKLMRIINYTFFIIECLASFIVAVVLTDKMEEGLFLLIIPGGFLSAFILMVFVEGFIALVQNSFYLQPISNNTYTIKNEINKTIIKDKEEKQPETVREPEPVFVKNEPEIDVSQENKIKDKKEKETNPKYESMDIISLYRELKNK